MNPTPYAAANCNPNLPFHTKPYGDMQPALEFNTNIHWIDFFRPINTPNNWTIIFTTYPPSSQMCSCKIEQTVPQASPPKTDLYEPNNYSPTLWSDISQKVVCKIVYNKFCAIGACQLVDQSVFNPRLDLNLQFPIDMFV